jgi:hypothetical protein
LDGKQIDFPRLIRRKLIEYMHRDYVEYFPWRYNRIGQTSFKKVVKALTTQDLKARKAVDYVSGRLMYDNFDLIRKIISRSNDSDDLKILANSLEAYLKTSFEEHIFKCCATNPDFAFAVENSAEKQKCSTCTLSQVVMQYLKERVEAMYHELLEECKQKLVLYQGHRIRVANQRQAINTILSDLEGNEGYVVMDYKMKFEAMYYREKTTDFYGKKGSSWHGAMIYSRYTSDQIQAHATESDAPLQPHHIFYYDQISSDDSTQDNGAVMSYFEAICIKIREHFPHISAIHVQTDNARCYKAPELIYALYVIAHHYSLKIICYIHTGIQDGKGPIDGHFATAMKHVSRFCNMGNDVVTPLDIVHALRANGGLNNSVADLISINRSKLQKFVEDNKDVIARLRKTKNHSEVRFDTDNKKITCFEYSDIGEGEEIALENSMSNEVEGTDVAVEEIEQQEEVEAEEFETNDDIIEDASSDDEDERFTELEVTATGDITGCSIFGGSVLRSICRTKASGAEKDDMESSADEDDALKCMICKKQFAHIANRRHHVCKGAIGKRDLVHSALKYAYERIDQHDLGIIMICDKDSEKGLLGELLDAPTNLEMTAGWAHPPKHGKMYGRNYIDPFKDDIARMFNAGNDDKAVRMGPARMLEKLKQKYPDRLDLPSETEIRQLITTLIAKQKKGQQATQTTTRGITMPYLATVIRIFNESNGTIKPAAAWTAFQQIHPTPINNPEEQLRYPTAAQVKGKISALRSQWRAANRDGN